MRTRNLLSVVPIALAWAALISIPARASDYSVLIDTDNDPVTGCSVAVAEEGFSGTILGVDHVLTAQESSFAVGSVFLESCVGGVLGAPRSISTVSYPVGPTAAGGLAVELAVPSSELGLGLATTLRLAFTVETDDFLAATDGSIAGPPILFAFQPPPRVPTLTGWAMAFMALSLLILALWSLRSQNGGLALISLLLLAVVSREGIAQLADGDPLDWLDGPLASDNIADSLAAESERELLSGFAAVSGGDLVFRLDVDATSPTLQDDGSLYTLDVQAPTELGVLLQSLRAATGFDLFMRELDEYSSSVAPTMIQDATLELLGAQLGHDFWATGPATDDAVFAARYPQTSAAQTDIDTSPPCTTCQGVMEDGWPGDTMLPNPLTANLDPPDPTPGPLGKVFDPSFPGAPAGTPQVESGTPETGSHIRLRLRTLAVGIQLLDAAQVSGDALLSTVHRIPPVGSVVCAAKSSLVATDGGYYELRVLDDPFVERAYNPPLGETGAHSHSDDPTPDLACPLSLLDPQAMSLSPLSLEVYRVVSPVPIGPTSPRDDSENALIPAILVANPGSFALIGTVTGAQIEPFLLPPTGPQPLAPAGPSTMVQLLTSGSKATKYNIAVIGDGFQAGEQGLFDTWVDNVILGSFLGSDIHPEILNAINVFRINTISTSSGVTIVDIDGDVTTSKDTALEYRFSGEWKRCRNEPGPNSVDLIEAEVGALLPEADAIFVILNHPSEGGGCRRSSHLTVTTANGMGVVSHEFAHYFGLLVDEYFCDPGDAGCAIYAGPEPTKPNLTRIVLGHLTKWKDWIPAWRPTPTETADVADPVLDVGTFKGATIGQQKYAAGIYRPSDDARMRSNTPEHNPVGYTEMRENARTFQEGDLRKTVVGDFNGDGRSDVVLLDDRQLSLYLSADRTNGPNDPVLGVPPRVANGVLEPTTYVTNILWNPGMTLSWSFRSHDILLPADFDGDGMDDLYVVNLDQWFIPYLGMLRSTGSGFEPVQRYDLELPAWDDMRNDDEFYVGDFSGDGKVDLMVFNGIDWDVPYFILLRSDGANLIYSKRYDGSLPGYQMGAQERFNVTDFNGDGKLDVIAHETQSWGKVHLQLHASTGSKLSLSDRHYGEIGLPATWIMRRGDVLRTPDFNGDAADDLVIFNGDDWIPVYLGLFETTIGGQLQARTRYDDDADDLTPSNAVPGWAMRRGDQLFAANIDGDTDVDLVIYNTLNWKSNFLGMLRSDGIDQLSGSWQANWIGGWNLGGGDGFHVVDFRGTGGWEDLFVYNHDWFGLLRSYKSHYALESIYRKWIHNHRYHDFGFY